MERYRSDPQQDSPDEDRSPGDVLDTLETNERVIARAEARRVLLLARFAREGGVRESVVKEVAGRVRWTPHRVERTLTLGLDLTSRLPCTLAAFRAGMIDQDRARAVSEPTGVLSDVQAGEVDRRIADKLVGKDPAQVRRAVRQQVLAVDPERARARREQRSLEVVHQEDGVSTLVADLPTEVATALYARCDRIARQQRRQGDERTVEQLRADVFADLALRESGTVRAPRTEVFLYFAASSLLGLDEQPGYLAGHGHIPAALARELASRPDGVWRRLLTDPVTGHPTDLGRTRYRPTAALDEFVRVRDRECRGIGCHRPSQRCQNDHTTGWAQGGTTNAKELVGYCERDHHLKDLPGWKYEVVDGVPTITTPHGDVHTNPPEPLHEPLTPEPDDTPPF
ncbi:DUF222 domain-containing protein [Amycolatopsis cihanbeyliensis]|uniref:DUF222 domain-containing protein n=1 Tax=Amycolatopsis cihanbeyliensis TaxID=1128664 RepID=UPI0014772AF0|nr:DUF222 domain-containing protein [Amycolatopsis cihanbeyliensis]